MTLFKDRREAGCRLAKKLIDYRKQGNVIVLALPRGGLPIGSEIAKQIEARLDDQDVRDYLETASALTRLN